MKIKFARNLRKNMTDAEIKLWQQLRRKQINQFHFRKQAPIGQYIVDFVCHECCLIIELDGGQHMEAIAYDAERTRWLESQGYKVKRFWNHEVLQNLDAVIEIIFNICRAKKHPPSLPSPTSGEGTRS